MPHVLPEAETRHEHPVDVAGVRRVNLAAFKTPAEADLVDALRSTVVAYVSLVAEVRGEIIGHILFTPVTVHPAEGASPWSASALGPMAVLPSMQNRGVGSALVRAGLDECRRQGRDTIFVLGHPSYYARFGFGAAPPRGLACAWNVPDEVFMVAELSPGAIAGRTGCVRYHELFANV